MGTVSGNEGPDTDLGRHGISELFSGIFRIKLPLGRGKPDHVNAYLFKGKQPLLFDTGMSRTVKTLESALNHLGMGFSDLDRIILSHGHFDHYGAAARIVTLAGKPISVLAHPGEAMMMARGNGLGLTMGELLPFLKQSGLPLRFRLSVVLIAFIFNRFAQKITITDFPKEGETLMAGDYPAQVIEAPGHSQGVLCLHLPGEGILLSSDHILSYLPHSDPYLFHFKGMDERFNQIEFFESLEKVRALRPRRIFPGHGEEIRDLDAVIRAYHREYDKKDEKMIHALGKGATTIYDLVRHLFPKVLKPLSGFPTYIAVSEVYTHLQVLVRDGRVLVDKNKGVARYSIRSDSLE